MGVATIEEANDPKLAQCLAILAGKTDEHKFAGLLMVAKHLQCEDEAALRRIRKAVLDTTGVSFFVRLLHTQGRGGCADNVETDARVSPFQSLALNLISSFCQDTSLAREFATTAVITVVLDVIPAAVSTGNAAVLQDCVHILHGLLPFDALKMNATWKATLVQQIHLCCVSNTDSDPMLCPLLSVLQASPEVSADALTSLCASFAAISTPSTGKARLQDYFIATLESHSPSTIASNVVLLARGLFGTWPAHVHDDGARRDSSLQLLALLLSYCGSNWLFHSELPWVLVSLQLAAIEAKLLLDDAERILIDHIVTPTPPEADEVKVLQRVHSLLPASYGILESILGGLMVEENASALSHTTLLQLKEVLGQVFTVVIEFITTCRDALRSSHLTFSMKDLDPIVLATIRVLGAWMAEETDLLTDQLVALVPFLVTYSPTSSMPVYPMSNVEEPWDSDDEVDDESSAPSLATGTDVMQFLLPGLLQLTATDGGATAVATDDAVLQKILQFTGVVCTRMVAESTASSAHGDLGEGVGTLTMCLGICLNVLLLATPSSACHRLFVKALPMWQSLAILSWRHVVVNNADVDARASDMYLMLLHIVSAMALVQPTAMAATSQLAACSTWLKDHPPSMACEGAWDLHELAMRVMK